MITWFVLPFKDTKSDACVAADDASAFTVIVIASVDVVVNAFNTDAAALVTVAVTSPLVTPATVFISVTLTNASVNVIFPVCVVIPANAAFTSAAKPE